MGVRAGFVGYEVAQLPTSIGESGEWDVAFVSLAVFRQRTGVGVSALWGGRGPTVG